MFDHDAEIIIVGNGLSELGSYLYEQGYHCLTNIDVSGVATKYMSDKNARYEDMEYAQMDVTDPDIGTHPESFQLVIDKGTLDSLVCCEGDSRKVEMMLINVYRMLAPGGHFICVSRGAPETRMGYL